LEKGFTIEVQFDGEYLKNLFGYDFLSQKLVLPLPWLTFYSSSWMGKNPGWAVLVWVILLLPFAICACILYKVLKPKKKKPKRGAVRSSLCALLGSKD